MCGNSPCGSESCTWGERHRFECEARDLMVKPYDVRHAYYRDVAKKRGEDAAKRLVAEVDRQWQISEESTKNRPATAGRHWKLEGQK